MAHCGAPRAHGKVSGRGLSTGGGLCHQPDDERKPRLLLALLISASGPILPPPGLACLPRWYAVQPVHVDGAWLAQLPSGERVPWDLGDRTVDARLAHPSIADLYRPRYATGAILPVNTPDHDPGRTRVPALLDATYGARVADRSLVTVELGGHPFRVHARVAPALRRVAARVDALLAADASVRPLVDEPGGGYAARNIAGSARRSPHAWGIAVDLSVKRADYWAWQRRGEPLRWRNRYPQSLVDAFEAEGFAWGGRWLHYDTMHFEYRPELFDPRCLAHDAAGAN